jgi:DNA-binding CsgD family transcriptional regulator
VVFGLSAGTPPDRFLVGLAVLSLLAKAAEQQPLLCVVDDAQWLDQSSALTLAFVARRLLAEPVGIVFAAREPGEALRGLPEMDVAGLRDGDARALLSSAVQFKLDERVRDRLIAETRGNPLALLELPRGLTAAQLAGGFGLVGAQALPDRIEESFVRRLEALPDDTRRLLLAAAAEPVGDPLLLWRAAESLGIMPEALAAAEAVGLLAVADRVMFRHPLVRSAIYGSADAHDLRAVHLALAEATDRDIDPDRRAWHLAAATTGPDEEVAAELERSAGRAQARGGLAAAAAFLRRATSLTQEPARRADRALAAAQASLLAGAFDSAVGLAASADAGPLDAFQSARSDLIRAHVAFASGLSTDAPLLLLNAARQLEAFDLDTARETYLAAFGAAGMAGGSAVRDVFLEICRAAQALPSADEPRPIELLLEGLTRAITDGPAAAALTLQRAASILMAITIEDVLRWGWMASLASTFVWDLDALDRISARQLQLIRDGGALGALPIHLSQLGMARPWLGDLAGTEVLVGEAETAAAATGSPIAPYNALRLRALQGKEREAAETIATAVALAATGQGMAANWGNWAAATLYNGLGRFEEAMSAARQVTADALFPIPAIWALPELVEAASRVGDTALARDALEQLAATTQPCATDPALGIEARCRALLSDDADADAHYGEAIERLSRTSLQPDLARAHLLYGEWLRRHKRGGEAREQLRIAHDLFVGIGMEAFAQRARKELEASGAAVRSPITVTDDALTVQERQIARLARDGLTNSEIGERLFLSPRTIEWHLRNVFAKLGIRSRRELPDAPAGPGSQPTVV